MAEESSTGGRDESVIDGAAVDHGFRKVSIDTLDAEPWEGVDPEIVPVGYELRPTQLRPNVWEYEPGDEMPAHRQQEQDELFYVMEGTAEMTVDGESFEATAGEFVFVPPENWRGFVATTYCRILAIGAPNTTNDGIFKDEE